METTIKRHYQNNKKQYEGQLAGLRKTDNSLVLYRSLAALSMVGLLIYGYMKSLPIFYFYVLPVLFVFVLMVQKHKK